VTAIGIDIELVRLQRDIDDVVGGSNVGSGDHFELVVEQSLRVVLVKGQTEAHGVLHDDVGVHLAKLDLEVSEVQVNLEVLVGTEFLLEQRKMGAQ
jgi:hypothetical protein